MTVRDETWSPCTLCGGKGYLTTQLMGTQPCICSVVFVYTPPPELPAFFEKADAASADRNTHHFHAGRCVNCGCKADSSATILDCPARS